MKRRESGRWSVVKTHDLCHFHFPSLFQIRLPKKKLTLSLFSEKAYQFRVIFTFFLLSDKVTEERHGRASDKRPHSCSLPRYLLQPFPNSRRRITTFMENSVKDTLSSIQNDEQNIRGVFGKRIGTNTSKTFLNQKQ